MQLIDQAALKALVAECVAELKAQLEQPQAAIPDGRLCYSEAEAARLLGLQHWQLRDERKRGRVSASQLVGGRIYYTRDDLVAYLNRRRLQATA